MWRSCSRASCSLISYRFDIADSAAILLISLETKGILMAKSRIQTRSKGLKHKKPAKAGARKTRTISVQVRRTNHRTKARSSQGHSSNEDRSYHGLSRSAANLIDQAAGLLKESISLGVKESVKNRTKIKEEAFQVVNTATKQLNDIVNVGAEYIRKGIKKL
jgi:hypothetical protein